MSAAANKLFNARVRKIAFGVLVAAGLYLLCLSPARAYWQQREDINHAKSRYETLIKANSEMNAQLETLRSDDEISRLARERYELVPQNTKAFAVMPPSTSDVYVSKETR